MFKENDMLGFGKKGAAKYVTTTVTGLMALVGFSLPAAASQEVEADWESYLPLKVAECKNDLFKQFDVYILANFDNQDTREGLAFVIASTPTLDMPRTARFAVQEDQSMLISSKLGVTMELKQGKDYETTLLLDSSTENMAITCTSRW